MVSQYPLSTTSELDFRQAGLTEPAGGLILQRHLLELVSTALVVADAGLVLASAAPVRPGRDVLGRMYVRQGGVHQESAYLRQRVADCVAPVGGVFPPAILVRDRHVGVRE